MTQAVAVVTNVEMTSTTDFIVDISFNFFDGNGQIWSFGQSISIPITAAAKPKKADNFIRQYISDLALNGNIPSNYPGGVTVDPDDIYFPMTN